MRWRTLTRRNRIEQELTSELGFHLDQQIEENLAAGMSTEAAEVQARRALGSIPLIQDQCRDTFRVTLLDDLRQDARYALRTFGKNPGFALAAILTLALGIGANSAIFSIVQAVLLKPLPYPDPMRLVRLIENVPATESLNGSPLRLAGMNLNELVELRRRTQTLSHVAAYTPATMTLTARDETIRIDGTRLSGSAFAMLGAHPMLGRTFESTDETAGSPPLAVLSFTAWHRHFGADPGIVGRHIMLDGKSCEIVGVMPSSFAFPDPQTRFWVPFVPSDSAQAVGSRVAMMARLKEGITPAAAASEIGTMIRDLRGTVESRTPSETAGRQRFELAGVQDELVAPVRPALLVLTVGVGFVLLIACANVGNLLLARTTAREREIAVRVALGAGGGRLARQVLTESVMLALLGGLAGTALTFGGIQLLRTLGATLARRDLGPAVSFPRLDEIGVNATVFLFTLAVSVVTGVLFGLAPAVRQSQLGQMNVLKEATSSTVSGFRLGRRHTVRSLFVIAETALAMVLLIGGGLMIRSFVKLVTVDLGYDPSHVLTFQVALPRDRYSNAQILAFAEEATTRFQAHPRVRAAGYAHTLPMVQFLRNVSLSTTPDPPRPQRPLGSLTPDTPDARIVSTDYFRVMGMRVIAGRTFGENDRAGQPLVMLINRTLARSGYLGHNPIGKKVYSIGREPWEIVGVVDDVRQYGLDRDPDPQIFADFRQWPVLPMTGLLADVPRYYAIRADGDPATLVTYLRAIVRQLDSQATFDNVATMEQLVSNSVSRPRLYASLLGIFSGAALTLAAIGIYGVIAYSVTRRTREIGIRVALGARRSDVLGLVLRQAATLTLIGIGIGIAGAVASTRYLTTMLFGLSALDLPTYAAVATVFAAVATFAAYVPARRALGVDPLVALRSE
jgi:putative ABC transport system permease protein